MKTFIILIVATALLSNGTFAEQVGMISELEALKKDWTLKREQALRPVDDKYQVALRSLKDRLTKKGDLEGALAVDKELKEVGLVWMKWTKLSAIRPKDSQVGWGEFLKGKLELKGRPMKVDGLPFEDGLFAHAPSRVVYNLKGKGYEGFRGSVGLLSPKSVGFRDTKEGSVRFRILGDGRELWQSDTIAREKGGDQTAEFLLNINGVSELVLVVDEIENSDWDSSIWIEPELGKN